MIAPPFTALADVYDDIMADVEYDEWCDFVLELAHSHGFRDGRVLDLACGTGNMAVRLARRGLQVDGVDLSAGMLAVARRKGPELDWFEGDFRTFATGRRYELIVCAFDSLNNILEPPAFVAAAANVRSHLLPGGLFLFDCNTRAGLSELWDGDVVEGWAGDVFYRWRHSFDAERGLARVEAYCEDATRAFTEIHQERPYDEGELRVLLAEAGFDECEAFEYPTGERPAPDAPRIWMTARLR